MKRTWAKIAALMLLLVTVLLFCASCGNYDAWDTTYRFDEAVILLPDGTTIRGTVQSWRDYGDGDQIQVKIEGVTYLLHSNNIVLIAK